MDSGFILCIYFEKKTIQNSEEAIRDDTLLCAMGNIGPSQQTIKLRDAHMELRTWISRENLHIQIGIL